MPSPRNRLLDVSDAAELLGITVRHVRRLIYERRIPYVKIGSRVRIDPRDLDRFVDEHRVDVE